MHCNIFQAIVWTICTIKLPIMFVYWAGTHTPHGRIRTKQDAPGGQVARLCMCVCVWKREWPRLCVYGTPVEVFCTQFIIKNSLAHTLMSTLVPLRSLCTGVPGPVSQLLVIFVVLLTARGTVVCACYRSPCVVHFLPSSWATFPGEVCSGRQNALRHNQTPPNLV